MITSGAASCNITNELGTVIQGATVGGIAHSIRDPLEANALYISQGETSILLVSCDIGGLVSQWTVPARKAMAKACGVPERNIIIGCTHTGGPSVIPSNYQKSIDEPYLRKLIGWLTDLSQQAVNAAVPACVRYGQGKAQVGYNRRTCWEDGSHSMFGDTSSETFIGLEGPHDPTHTAVGIETIDGAPLAVMHMNTAHPCTFYGADFYSADYPGTARGYLREAMGDIPVLFFNGAQGDICSEDITVPQDESADRKLARLGHLLAGETLRLLHESQASSSIDLRHSFIDLAGTIRLPSSERLTWAADILSRVDAGEDVSGMDITRAYSAVLLKKRYDDGDIFLDTIPVHAIRLGELAIVSEPCELFCQYGLDIRRRSPAPMTALLGLSDGYQGYCPTPAAMNGGGYSGEPTNTARFVAGTGDAIVDASSRLLHNLWS